MCTRSLLFEGAVRLEISLGKPPSAAFIKILSILSPNWMRNISWVSCFFSKQLETAVTNLIGQLKKKRGFQETKSSILPPVCIFDTLTMQYLILQVWVQYFPNSFPPRLCSYQTFLCNFNSTLLLHISVIYLFTGMCPPHRPWAFWGQEVCFIHFCILDSA